jgi:type IV fimbrial biogenesis protein FimT
MRRPPKHSAGFTLLELMTALSVAGVLLAIGVPAFTDITRNNRLTTAANDLLHSTQLARTEAIKRQLPVAVCASDDSAAATPTCNDGEFSQWIVFVDTDGDWSPDEGEPVLERHAPLNEQITVRNDFNGIISYSPNGFATPPLSGGKQASQRIVLCDARGNQLVGTENSAARALIIEATGRTRVTRKRTDVAEAITTADAGDCP